MVIVEQRILIGILQSFLDVLELFTRHGIKLIARRLGSYSMDIIREFYASYVENLRGSLDKRAKSAKKDPLTQFLV